MKRLLNDLSQFAGVSIILCGIICGMCETEHQIRTMLIAFALLITGAAICYISKEKEYGTY